MSSNPHKVTTQKYEVTDRSKRIWDVIEEHRPQSESYALKYGSLILAVPCIFSSFITQRYFNRRFKIAGKSFFMYPPMLIPAIAAGLLHRKMIEEQVLHESIQCTGCTEFQSALVQVVAGPCWSFVLSPFSACMIGSLRKSIYVPPIEKYPLETLKFVANKFKGFGSMGLAICVGNFAFTLVITNLEIKQYTYMKLRMLARLSQFDSTVSSTEFFDFAS